MRSFSLLSEKVRRALSESGFKKPSPIQEAAIPVILSGRHVLLIAPTGIGKTEAALLPIFSRLTEGEGGGGIRLLYITPLRALNRDLLSRLEWWGERLGMRIDVRHGDTTAYRRRKQALSPPDMLITTPETLQAILTAPLMRRHLRGVRFVVVDEVHELAESKRGAQLSVALERLRELTQRDFQRIGISATVGSPGRVARFLCCSAPVEVVRVSAAKEMRISVEYPSPRKEDRELAEQLFTSVSAASRVRRLRELISRHRHTLIFVNTREAAEVLASRFKIMGEPVGIHHSSLSKEVRIAAEEEFKRGKLRALICTSSLELGIDIGSVDLVVQYSSPRQVSRIIQRVGRSGHRLGGVSRGVVITTDADDTLEALVIARRAGEEMLEEVEPHRKPYDVLAHQLVGIALEYRRVEKERALSVLRRSYAFADLELEELEEVLSLLAELRLLWVEEERFGTTRASREYYYANLSTIPDEKRYFVRNMVTRENVGVLDEAFVVNYAEPGSRIIFKGSPWRVVSVQENEVLVEPLAEVHGAVPSWVGEEIPVPYEVAQEVAELRERAAREGEGALSEYPCDAYTAKRALSGVRRHLRRGIPVPGRRKLHVELLSGLVVVHAPFGMKVNETLGRVFAIILTSRLGQSVALRSDAYRIILHTGVTPGEEDVLSMLEVMPEHLEQLLAASLKRTSLFRWKFVHVAKRFGAISRDYTYTSSGLRRLMRAYEGSVIYRETLREIFRDNLDIPRTRKVLEKIREGEIEVVVERRREPSPIAEPGLRNYGEVVLPERAERLILRALKRRIAQRRVEMFCLYCASWYESFRVGSIPENLRCGRCSARMLAVLKGSSRELRSLYRRYKRGEKLSREEMREVRKLQLSANLFLSYGRAAAVAMAARGVGPETAKRVLARALGEEELYREILKAEREYARTRMYWD
ncbi:MAG: DEAD/DEAH box helicase [Euryarchaeota archaeon]|nr:DEAD/DEAH box helicase [Euryarchaeota archaeon]